MTSTLKLRESAVFRSARLHKPVPTSIGNVRVVEPFSTALGLPISTEACPPVGGTGGLFISDPRYPDELFLVTARQVVIQANRNDNELVECDRTSQRRRKVLLFSESAASRTSSPRSRQRRTTLSSLDAVGFCCYWG